MTSSTPSARVRRRACTGWTVVVLTLIAGCTQPSPPAAVFILGRNVSTQYQSDVAPADRRSIGKALTTAATLLDQHAKDFTPAERRAIGQIHTILITASEHACLGQTDRHAMTLSVPYIRSASTPWLASLVGHEGQHALDAGIYTGDEAWKDERKASQVQLAIGRTIGLSATEVNYLQGWANSQHHVAMQQHMQQGYPRNCTVQE